MVARCDTISSMDCRKGSMKELAVKSESKHDRFKRLAAARGERVLKDIALLGNLSHRGNYEYSEAEVRKLFATIEAELRDCKARFTSAKPRRRIEL